jgi:GTP cyclohydrolase I
MTENSSSTSRQEREQQLAAHYSEILPLLGEDPQREGLVKTPRRVARAWMELTRGYDEDPIAILRSALFKESYHNMVVVRDIEFYSLCEHHLLPFFGHVHIAYIPNGEITGLSKLARIVDTFSHRLQVQERMTEQIAHCIQEALNPLGVMVVVEARHLCMQMRGVAKQNANTTTMHHIGAFNDPVTRNEFLSQLFQGTSL